MTPDDRTRYALVQIANGRFENANGQRQLITREQMINLARRTCVEVGLEFSAEAVARRVPSGDPLPPLTDEQRRIYNKLRPVLGREAALAEVRGSEG